MDAVVVVIINKQINKCYDLTNSLTLAHCGPNVLSLRHLHWPLEIMSVYYFQWKILKEKIFSVSLLDLTDWTFEFGNTQYCGTLKYCTGIVFSLNCGNE